MVRVISITSTVVGKGALPKTRIHVKKNSSGHTYENTIITKSAAFSSLTGYV